MNYAPKEVKEMSSDKISYRSDVYFLGIVFQQITNLFKKV